MQVIVSHMSALNYLDKCARKADPPNNHPKPFVLNPTVKWAHTKHQIERFDLDRFRQPNRPLDILVEQNEHLHSPKGYKLHGPGGRIPRDSLLDAGNGVLVCSAPLIFVMMCGALPLMRCVRLGSFICSEYSLEATARSGVVKRFPLSTTQGLRVFSQDTRSVRGHTKALSALEWVLDGAASPQETELALPFYLPNRLGGKGFIAPALNHRVDLDPHERYIAQSEYFKVDVCWPEQGVGFEYNSYSDHSDPQKIAEDERRKLVLRSKGIHVELVTKQQLDDPHQLDLLAGILEEHGVPRQRKPTP